MQQNNNTICVVYLIWIPYKIGLFETFLTSYKRFEAGKEHNLVLLFNGVKEESDMIPYHALMKEWGITYTSFCLQEGQDIDAYFYAANRISEAYIFFLNSYSVLLADNWLKKVHLPFENPAVGLVGATGSWESYYSGVFFKNTWGYEFKNSFKTNFRKYKLLVKTIFYWRFLFKPFPNPHIRTNAFMLRRTDLLRSYPGKIRSKFKAYQFENGRKSLTNYYLRKGLKVLVVDKYGKTYEPNDWMNSLTFRISDQQNLLVADNQTGLYYEASEDNRKSMTKLAWGIK